MPCIISASAYLQDSAPRPRQGLITAPCHRRHISIRGCSTVTFSVAADWWKNLRFRSCFRDSLRFVAAWWLVLGSPPRLRVVAIAARRSQPITNWCSNCRRLFTGPLCTITSSGYIGSANECRSRPAAHNAYAYFCPRHRNIPYHHTTSYNVQSQGQDQCRRQADRCGPRPRRVDQILRGRGDPPVVGRRRQVDPVPRREGTSNDRVSELDNWIFV